MRLALQRHVQITPIAHLALKMVASGLKDDEILQVNLTPMTPMALLRAPALT